MHALISLFLKAPKTTALKPQTPPCWPLTRTKKSASSWTWFGPCHVVLCFGSRDPRNRVPANAAFFGRSPTAVTWSELRASATSRSFAKRMLKKSLVIKAKPFSPWCERLSRWWPTSQKSYKTWERTSMVSWTQFLHLVHSLMLSWVHEKKFYFYRE